MSRIDAEAIEVAAHWMMGDPAPGNGTRFQEWAEARDVDIQALIAYAHEETQEALDESRGRIGEGGLREAMWLLSVQSFVAGLESERRRRDTGLPR